MLWYKVCEHGSHSLCSRRCSGGGWPCGLETKWAKDEVVAPWFLGPLCKHVESWAALYPPHECPCWTHRHTHPGLFTITLSSCPALGLAPLVIFTHTEVHSRHLFKKHVRPPWRYSGWESACQCRELRFDAWARKIPYASEQLSPWAIATETHTLEPVLCNKRNCCSEKPMHHNEE